MSTDSLTEKGSFSSPGGKRALRLSALQPPCLQAGVRAVGPAPDRTWFPSWWPHTRPPRTGWGLTSPRRWPPEAPWPTRRRVLDYWHPFPLQNHIIRFATKFYLTLCHDSCSGASSEVSMKSLSENRPQWTREGLVPAEAKEPFQESRDF